MVMLENKLRRTLDQTFWHLVTILALQSMLHAASKARKPLLHDFTSGKLIRETKLAQQVPIMTVIEKTIQHA